ncbi:MAG: glycosyltransferase family 2 protein [Ginsengibacter sp.]
MLTFIIIPIYNESKVIYKLLQNEEFRKYSLILVDDGSKDPLSLNEISIPFYFVQHSENLGQGAALQTGMEMAKLLQADIAVHFDGDGQHDPTDIDALTEPVRLGKAHVVIGSRFLKHKGGNNPSKIPFSRKIILQCARFVQFLFTGMILTDSQNGLRALSAAALQSIQVTENRMAHAIELIQIFKTRRFAVLEAPVNITYTEYSNLKGQKVLNGFFIVLRLLVNKLVKNISFSALLITLPAGIFIWLFKPGLEVLPLSGIFIFMYLFNICWLLIVRNTKKRFIAATSAIRHESLQNAKRYNY